MRSFFAIANQDDGVFRYTRNDRNSKGNKNDVGFTLIELLVVIAILAILATVIVVIINPGELLKQSRDTDKMADLASLNKSLGLLLVDQPNASLGNSNVAYVSIPDATLSGTATSTCTSLGLPTLPAGYFYECHSPDTYRKVDGTGWIPVNFSQFSTGNVIPILPVDKNNTTSTGMYYTYSTQSGSWEITGSLESAKYISKGSLDAGLSPFTYEIGSSLELLPTALIGRSASYTQLTNDDPAFLAWWKFDEGSGSTAGDSENSSTGTITGATWLSGANCKISNCLAFSSSTNTNVRGALSPSVPAGGDYTQIAWVYPTSFGAVGCIFDDYNNAEHYMSVETGGALRGDYYNSPPATQMWAYTAGVVPLNTWSFIATTVRSGKSIRTYYNGFQVGENTSPSMQTKIWDDFVFGQYGGGSSKFDGRIDDARAYSRALTGAEILAIYNATK